LQPSWRQSHEETGRFIGFICHALGPVGSGGFQLPEGDGSILHFEPEWHERALTQEEADSIQALIDIFLR